MEVDRRPAVCRRSRAKAPWSGDAAQLRSHSPFFLGRRAPSCWGDERARERAVSRVRVAERGDTAPPREQMNVSSIDARAAPLACRVVQNCDILMTTFFTESLCKRLLRWAAGATTVTVTCHRFIFTPRYLRLAGEGVHRRSAKPPPIGISVGSAPQNQPCPRLDRAPSWQ